VDTVIAQLKQRNPGFDGKVTYRSWDEEGVVRELEFLTDHVTDVSRFFQGNDLWTVPLGQKSEQSLPSEAYYVVMRMPGEPSADLADVGAHVARELTVDPLLQLHVSQDDPVRSKGAPNRAQNRQRTEHAGSNPSEPS
jgi:hypothetical protein